MDKGNLMTVDGRVLDNEYINELVETFERDWEPSEYSVRLTERGKILKMLNEINVPLHEVEALERRAKQNKQSLASYIGTIIHNDLLALYD